MNGGATPIAETVQRGRTTLTGRALHGLAVGIVAGASGAEPREISLRWDDANGGLHATVTLPLVLRDATGGTLEEQGAALRMSLVAGMAERAGRHVDGVDLRFSGVRRGNTRRVR